MNIPELLAFADKLPETVRYQHLDNAWKYFQGVQYAGRPLTVTGYRKDAPSIPGSLSTSPPWSDRDPGAVWNLAAEVVNTITEWSVSGDAWCHLAVDDDPDAADWLCQVEEQSALCDTIADARVKAGATGTAVVSMAVRDGEFFFESHNPRDCWVTAWDDQVRRRPAEVVQVFDEDDPFALDAKSRTKVARVWTRTTESYLRRVRDHASGEWRWDQYASLQHGLGFCPVYWFAQGNVAAGQTDGESDIELALGIIDEANELYAGAGATTKRNADDTLVVREDPALNPGRVRKGGFNTIFARGGAEYLSQDGESARICMELAEKRAQQIYRRARVVIASVDDLARATSGEAFKRLYQPLLQLAGRVRRQIARWLIVPLCRDILRVSRRMGATSVFTIPPRVEHVSDNVGVRTVVTPRTPGKSEFVRCAWPNPAPPTADDIQKLVMSLSTATGGKQIIAQRTAVTALAATSLPVENVEAELERIEEDGERAAEQGAAALGLATEAKGAAGAIDDEPADDEGKGAAA